MESGLARLIDIRLCRDVVEHATTLGLPDAGRLPRAWQVRHENQPWKNLRLKNMKTEPSNSAQSEWEIRVADSTKEQLWALVRRIKESYPLNKAPRSRVLFEYLCAH